MFWAEVWMSKFLLDPVVMPKAERKQILESRDFPKMLSVWTFTGLIRGSLCLAVEWASVILCMYTKMSQERRRAEAWYVRKTMDFRKGECFPVIIVYQTQRDFIHTGTYVRTHTHTYTEFYVLHFWFLQEISVQKVLFLNVSWCVSRSGVHLYDWVINHHNSEGLKWNAFKR